MEEYYLVGDSQFDVDINKKSNKVIIPSSSIGRIEYNYGKKIIIPFFKKNDVSSCTPYHFRFGEYKIVKSLDEAIEFCESKP